MGFVEDLTGPTTTPTKLTPKSKGTGTGDYWRRSFQLRITVRCGLNIATRLEVRNQHLVSKVVLRRFTNRYGELLRVNLDTGDARYLHPSAIMYQTDFISVERNEAEELWRTVEDHMREVYLAIENKTIHDDARAAKTVKDCIALHFIRSETMKGIADRSTAETIALMRWTLAEEPQKVADQYLAETGIRIEGPEGLSHVIDRIMASIEAVLRSAQEFNE